MIQVGDPVFLQVTDPTGTPGLNYAARVFDASGPITAWMALTNFDGNSYRLPYTYAATGAYSEKYVVFTDGTLTVRDTNYAESDKAVQVEDVSGGGGGSSSTGCGIFARLSAGELTATLSGASLTAKLKSASIKGILSAASLKAQLTC